MGVSGVGGVLSGRGERLTGGGEWGGWGRTLRRREKEVQKDTCVVAAVSPR